MKPLAKDGLVIGFQPSSHGFGWAAFSSPLALYDWGLCHAKTNKNVKCMRRLERILSRLEPRTIVLEAFETDGARRSGRVIDLCRAVVSHAIDQRIEVAIYPRSQILARFGAVGARTRQQVAEAVARSFVELRPRLPRPRAAWDAPDRRMALFDAAAVAQTHFQISASNSLTALVDETP
jgi:Holliday junction resolvasome RuvABC endonuclease subunit